MRDTCAPAPRFIRPPAVRPAAPRARAARAPACAPARRGLDRSTRIVTTPHAARRLSVLHGFRQAAGLRTWEGCVLRRGGVRVRITSLPGRHAGQAVLRGLLPPVRGSLLEFGPEDGPVRLRLYLS